MTDIGNIVARGQQFRLVREDEALRNFGGGEQIIVNRAAYWSFSIPILPRAGVQAKKWRAALVELANPANKFEATPPGYRGSEYARARVADVGPLLLSNGTNLQLSNNTLLAINPGFFGGGEVLIDGANQLGTSLSYKNADPNETVFNPGEYFSLDGELKVATATSVSDGSGKGTVSFQPPLRTPPDDELFVEMFKPFARFRIKQNTGWSLQPNRLHSFTLEATESY